jgi:F-type H+-transporting ATPase subunit epsilon
MAATFRVDVVTPEAVVWSGEAEFLLARTTEGDIGVYANHEPTMAALGTGAAEIGHAGGRTKVALHGGFLQIFRNQVTLLTDRAEISEGTEDILERAAALREAEEAEEAEGDEAGAAT